MMTRFTGIIPPVCTPLDSGGEVDAAGLERLVARLLDAGVHGVFALGSTGEAIYLDDRKRRRVLEIVVGACSGQVPVFAGALDATPSRVFDQLRLVDRFAVGAVVVTAPFYADTTTSETTRHFELVARMSTQPVLAYDIPENVGRELPTDVAIDLLQRDVLAGLKDSSGAMDEFGQILRTLGAARETSILTGSDSRAAEALALGADGIVPGIGNVIPELMVALYDGYVAGDLRAVTEVQAKITAATALFDIGKRHGLGTHASQLGGLKHVLHRDGVIASATLSPPLSPYPDAAQAELYALFEKLEL